MPDTRAANRADGSLMGTRRRADYNAAERAFSLLLRQRLSEVLEGKRNNLDLLRRYPGQPDRLGIITTPPGIRRDELRLPVVERLTCEVVDFVSSDAVGGPVAQCVAPDGSVLELQTFPTKYPHVVIERADRYLGDAEVPVEITWRLRRVQNQRTQTRINRLLDAVDLGFELLRLIR